MSDLKYTADLKRETDCTDTSIAIENLCNVLRLIENRRNNEVEFYQLIAHAKELQKGLYNIEMELKRQLKEELERTGHVF